MIGALAAIIGGVVVFWLQFEHLKQSAAAMKAAEMCRAKLIDMINPMAVGVSREWRPSKR